MLEWIFIALLCVGVLLFFHNQATYEFKIAQIDWDQRSLLPSLLEERGPLVLQNLPPVAFWTQQDVLMRDGYGYVPVFEDQSIAEWLVTATPTTACPWGLEHARLLGSTAGLGVWAERDLDQAIKTNAFWSTWYSAVPSCWAGERSLWKSLARWTVIMPTEGSIQVSILAGSNDVRKSLPPDLTGVHPSRLTIYDTPFVKDLQYMDIVLRPGSCLVMPPHWFLSWQSLGDMCPMVCVVEYHTPVSRWMPTPT